MLCSQHRALCLCLTLLLSAVGCSLAFSTESSQPENQVDRWLAEGADYVMRWMPTDDKAVINRSQVEADVRIALQARTEFPWASEVPWPIYCNDVLPYAAIDEARIPWRQQFYDLFAPVVRECQSSDEAILKIATSIKEKTGVKYSVERSKPNQASRESMAQGKASCTGLSILMIDALRAVGIPARMAGLLTWSHIPGNHSWVEAWSQGKWKMIEFGEAQFDTPWVMDNIKKLDPSRDECRIFATTWGRPAENVSYRPFPLIWRLLRESTPDGQWKWSVDPKSEVYGVDVTDDYLNRVGKSDTPENTEAPPCVLYLDYVSDPEALVRGEAYHRIPIRVSLLAPDGSVLASGETPDAEADMRQFLELPWNGNENCSIEWTNRDGQKRSLPIGKSSKDPIIHLHD